MRICGRKPKLTPEQIKKAREWASIGRTFKQAAMHFGVSPSVLRNYINGKHKRVYE